MTLAARPAFGRIAAVAILVALIALGGGVPLAAYCGLVAGNSDALSGKEAILQRYRLLAESKPSAVAPTGPALLYPNLPDAQAAALLQETVKTAAAVAHVQVQGLQVLRSETQAGAARIGVRVRASGDVTSLRGLIYAIESARPALYPDNLQIQAHTVANAPAPTLDFQLDVTGFKTEPAS